VYITHIIRNDSLNGDKDMFDSSFAFVEDGRKPWIYIFMTELKNHIVVTIIEYHTKVPGFPHSF